MNSKAALLALVESAIAEKIITPEEISECCARQGGGLQMYQQPAMGGPPANGGPMGGGGPSICPPGFHKGVVKSFSPKDGYGFIDCPELKEQHGNDVFLHKSQIYNCGFTINQNDPIYFKCEINKMGKPQAVDLKPAWQ